MFTPAGVLLIWFRGLIAVGVVVAAGYLLYAWQQRVCAEVVTEDFGNHVESELRPGTGASDLVPSSGHRRRRLMDWRPGWDEPTALLAGAFLLTALSIGGRFVSPRLARKNGEAMPALVGGKKVELVRPDGTHLHVEVFGESGPTTIATHGWGTDRQEFAHLVPAVRAEGQLIVWDLPGSGLSSRPNNDDYSLERFAHDLRAVFELAGENQVGLVGHSIGGMTTLTFCRLFPDLLGRRISGIVLVHTTYQNPLRTMLGGGLLSAIEKPIIVPLLYLQIWLSPLVWLGNCLSYLNGSVHWSNAFTGFGGTENRQKLDFVSQYSLTVSPAVLARGCLGMLKFDVEEHLRHISVPVLVVSGERDPVTLPEANHRIAAGVPQGKFATLNAAKHYGFLEHDARFRELIRSFLRSVKRS